MDWHIWATPLIIFCIALPFMVLSTTGSKVLASLGFARARHLLDEGQKKLAPFVNAPNEYWMTIVTIEVLSVIAMFWSGFTFLTLPPFHISSWVAWIILAAIYFVFHSVFCVLLSRGDERMIAPRIITLLKPFNFILKPITWPLSLILKPVSKQQNDIFANAERIEEELEVMLDESTRQGGLEDMKGKIMRSAIDYSDTTVREVMIPRTDLTACPLDTHLDDALRLFVAEGYSRLPVYDGNIDTIVGILYFKDVVQKYFELRNDDASRDKISVKSLVRDAFFVPETNHIDAIFEDFKREHIHIAIVVDEFGGTAGLVTLEDIVEEFFGDIQDEYDSEENTIIPIDNDKQIVLVDAKTSISDIAEHFNVDIEESPDYESIGGLVTYILGHVGTVGEEIDINGLHCVVRKASDRCILQIEISKEAAAAPQE